MQPVPATISYHTLQNLTVLSGNILLFTILLLGLFLGLILILVVGIISGLILH